MSTGPVGGARGARLRRPRRRRAPWAAAAALLVAAGCHRAPPPLPLPPLLAAARAGDVGALRALLDGGAPLDTADDDGRRALHWAALGGSAAAVELLLDRGADLDAPARLGMTALHWAALAGKARAAEALLRRGADPGAPNAYGLTPLHEAATPELAQLLLARGARLEARDRRDMTPLHTARNGKVAKVLLAASADVFATSTDGRRPLDMATAGDWDRFGVVLYAPRRSVRLRGDRASLALELRNISERAVGPITVAAESPACDVEVPPPLPRLAPAQLAPFTLHLTRRPDAEGDEVPLLVSIASDGVPIARVELRLDATRAETPQDRGMVRIGKATLRRPASPLQYAVFAAPPLIVAAVWLLQRRRRGAAPRA